MRWIISKPIASENHMIEHKIELKYEFTLVQIDYAKLNFVILVANALNQPVERTLEVIYKEFMQSSSF